MKVIDLLNKIANGEEVPNIILFNSYKYRFDKIDRVYRRIIGNSTFGNSTLGTINELDLYLNDDVEIIEDTPKEDKKIEKLKLSGNDFIDIFKIENKINKINEIIDKVNGE